MERFFIALTILCMMAMPLTAHAETPPAEAKPAAKPTPVPQEKSLKAVDAAMNEVISKDTSKDISDKEKPTKNKKLHSKKEKKLKQQNEKAAKKREEGKSRQASAVGSFPL